MCKNLLFLNFYNVTSCKQYSSMLLITVSILFSTLVIVVLILVRVVVALTFSCDKGTLQC